MGITKTLGISPIRLGVWTIKKCGLMVVKPTDLLNQWFFTMDPNKSHWDGTKKMVVHWNRFCNSTIGTRDF